MNGLPSQQSFFTRLCISLLSYSMAVTSASIHPKHLGSPNNNTAICGKRLFTEASGYVASPGFPERYPLNLICTYEIIVTEGFRIELDWKDFDIDGEMPRCDDDISDYVDIYLGCKTNKKYLTRFCSRNSGIPHPIYSTDHCITIKFATKPNPLAKTNKGFLAQYRAVNMTKSLTRQHCNRTLSADHGILHSTLWPNTYNNEAMDFCQWHIRVDPDSVVKFSIMDLATQNSYEACNVNYYGGWEDAVSVKGIGSNFVSVASLRKFFGHCLPFTYSTDYSELLVEWKMMDFSYYDYSNRGFIIGYTAYRPVSGRTPAIWQICLLAFAVFISSLLWCFMSCRCRRNRASAKSQNGEYSHLSDNDSDSQRHINIETDNDNETNTVNERNIAAERNSLISYEGYPRSNDGSSQDCESNILVQLAGFPYMDSVERHDTSLNSAIGRDPHPAQEFVRSAALETHELLLHNQRETIAATSPSEVFLASQSEASQQVETIVNDLIDYTSDVEPSPSAPCEQCIPESPPPDYDEIFQGLQALISVSADGYMKCDKLE